MLVAGKRVADEDGVAAVGVEPALGFVAYLERGQRRAAVEPERPGERGVACEAEALVVGHEAPGYGAAERLVNAAREFGERLNKYALA